MKAWVLQEPKPVEEHPLRLVDDFGVPQPGEGEIRLSVEACGVCHTDLHTVEGDLDLPHDRVVPGHEVVGVVAKIGPGVQDVTEGEVRGVYWLHEACGACEFCDLGHENLCLNPRFTGLQAQGGYAEKIVAPAEYTVKIPAGFTPTGAAPLLCAGIIGYRSLKLSDFQPGETLALFGFGASAHLVIQVATHRGAEVVVYTRSEEHQRHARELGAVYAANIKEGIPQLADRAITFAPAGWLVVEALKSIRKGGTVAVNAISMSDIPSFPYRVLMGEKTLRSVSNVTRTDAQEFMSLAGEIPIETTVEVYEFAEANQALADVKHSRVKGAAVLRME